MPTSLIEGFLLGLGAAVPLGPINILIMNEAMKRYQNGLILGLGAMSADILYLLLILFGLLSYVDEPIVLEFLSFFGGLFLLYLAYIIFKSRDKKLNVQRAKTDKKSMLTLYLKGFILTFMNPYTIAFWLSVSGYVVNNELNPFAMIFGLFSALLLWITLMPYFIHKSRHKISQKASSYIAIISSIILFGFGATMLINLLK